MPIKGLSDRKRMTRLGKIRLGIKVKDGNREYPRATDYFVCPPEVQAVFGEQPSMLRIMFATEDPEQWASQFYRSYSRTHGLVCKGDGETAMALIDDKTGDLANRHTERSHLRERPCPGRECPTYQAKQCREVMNLQFLIPEVEGIGVWQIDTSSINSILNINSAIELISGLTGRISMIPLELHLGPQTVQPEGRKKVVRVLNVVAPYKLAGLLNAATKPPAELLLPSPDTDVPDDLFPSDGWPEGEEMDTTPVPADAPEASEPASEDGWYDPLGNFIPADLGKDELLGLATPAWQLWELHDYAVAVLGIDVGKAWPQILSRLGMLGRSPMEIDDIPGAWRRLVELHLGEAEQ